MIFAVDFDGTLCEYAWPGIGKPKYDVIDAITALQECGHKVILWTCREGENLDDAVQWCKEHNLYFDAVNDNVESAIYQHNGSNSRKVFAHYYIDDRSLDLDDFLKTAKEEANVY